MPFEIGDSLPVRLSRRSANRDALPFSLLYRRYDVRQNGTYPWSERQLYERRLRDPFCTSPLFALAFRLHPREALNKGRQVEESISQRAYSHGIVQLVGQYLRSIPFSHLPYITGALDNSGSSKSVSPTGETVFHPSILEGPHAHPNTGFTMTTRAELRKKPAPTRWWRSTLQNHQ